MFCCFRFCSKLCKNLFTVLACKITFKAAIHQPSIGHKQSVYDINNLTFTEAGRSPFSSFVVLGKIASAQNFFISLLNFSAPCLVLLLLFKLFCVTVSKSCIIHRSITLMLLRLNQTFQYSSFFIPPSLHCHTDNSFPFCVSQVCLCRGLKRMVPLVTMNLHFVHFRLFCHQV